RGGFGIFYDRIGESLSLQANRFNGINQQQFLITDASILDLAQFTLGGVTNVPTVDALTSFSQPQTTRLLADDLQAPYTIQSSLSVERQLPYNFTFSATYINARALHLLRSRNINAPLPGSIVRDANNRIISAAFPLGAPGNFYQYESSGRLNQNQLIFGVQNRLNRNFTIFGRYSFNNARSDTDGANSFPVNQYDVSTEYGRAGGNSFIGVRHRFTLAGTINAPWGVRLNPFVIASSGQPFNITTGRDTNGDTLFNDRPAFATDPSKPGVVTTPFGAFDPNPTTGQALIPRNFGTGPSFFTTNLALSKTFGLGGGGARGAAVAQDGSAGGGGRRGGGGRGGGFGGGGGGRGGFGGEGSEGRYNLTFTVRFENLLNNTNEAPPVGNLSSPFFGQSISTAGGFGFGPGGGGGGGGNTSAGNRRVIGQIRFSF
ncbi:MAG: hypothetical protein H0T45_04270, partial [Pyrinomonadaceae bacterium]|nr:hypothetical protein [Pyrinomonadaceae bacterium]